MARSPDRATRPTAGLPSAPRDVIPIDDTVRNEILALIREQFTTHGPCDRDTAVRRLAAALGYHRVGPRIREILDNDLRTAVRRGILDNAAGTLSLLARHIDDYAPDHLITILVAAVGHTWTTREVAITQAARHLGYRRTGPKIQTAFKSAIKTALRRHFLESHPPNQIRRPR